MADLVTTPDVEEAIRDLLIEASLEGSEDVYLVRRKHQRHTHDIRLEWQNDEADDQLMAGVLADISQAGLALWVREKLKMGDEIVVRRWPGRDEDVWIPGEVRHCELGLKGYLVGVRFAQPVHFDPPVRPIEEPVEDLAKKRMPTARRPWGKVVMVAAMLVGSSWWLMGQFQQIVN